MNMDVGVKIVGQNDEKYVLASVISKYIQYIRDVEGVDYILDIDNRHMTDIKFTD